jgi:3-dehydroquinate synthetase
VPKGPVEPFLAVMRRDKKNQGDAMRFVLPRKPCEVELATTVLRMMGLPGLNVIMNQKTGRLGVLDPKAK